MGLNKYSDDLALTIVSAIEDGATDQDAAALAGIDRTTYYRWLKAGEAGVEPYATFAALARIARARRQFRRVKQVESAGPDDWKAAAWLLERSDPRAWGKRPPRRQGSGTARTAADITAEAEARADLHRPDSPPESPD